ncbi:ABC transporter EcsB [Caldalkalibacillus thermarum TA2.A1]|uniref:ABC transporter EcsB n=1 Tax=Caldalkalibacillus thermarum (strain TA2.A1) TaxID=986075 RepID=F5L755_CALTT|nr:ABC transporter permease [Caldalkalibacillus thermarum]EGL82831.1 ABC transporter EcsB [Caldalkalibacillus thermarum TA2.A1]QZT34865.1 ABC transporter permease [Caldalkalibacillus thermarum TA2.A1]
MKKAVTQASKRTSTASGADQSERMFLDVEQLARNRIQEFVTEAVRYWQLIASSGLLFTVVVLLIIGMIYYDQIVAWIPDWMPMGFIYAVVFCWLVARAPQRHFLHEADLIFLTPVESRMDDYFRHTYRYNLMLQSAAVVVIAILLYPIWRDTVAAAEQPVWGYFLLPLALKGWNFSSHWAMLRHVDERKVEIHRGLRILFSFIFLLWWFYQGPAWLLPVLVLPLVAFFLFERKVVRSHGYRWMRLLELEQKQLSRFYAFCQAFVDVPHMGTRVRKRPWLSYVTALLPFNRTSAYRYLYLKTFIRAQDYLGIYVRLTLIGTVMIYVLNDVWVKGLVYLLFLFVAATQLQAVWTHHQQQFWHQLFPLSHRAQRDSFVWMCRVVLGMQALVMFMPILVSGSLISVQLMILAAATAFIYFFTRRIGMRISAL